MEKKEQEMLEKIRSASEELRVPESLEPARVREQLEKHDREKQAGRSRKQGKAGRFLRSVRGRQVTALAAGLALVCLAGAAYTLSVRDSGGAGEADSEAASGAAASGSGQSSGKTGEGELRAAGSYDDVYAYLEEYQEKQEEIEEPSGIWGGARLESASGGATSSSSGVAERSQADSASAAADSSADSYSGSYSDTNVRQAGVDEGDVVKTDGRYIYTLTDEGEITIVDTEGGMKEAGVISEDRQILEFYVADTRLMLLAGAVNDMGEYTDGTALVTYDISDRTEPRKLGEVTQSGSYRSSRMVGDYVYVFTTFYADMFAAQEARESYVPQAGGGLIQESSIYLPETDSPSQYLVMTSTDIKAPDRIADSKALFAGYGELYVSNENIYWYENTSEHNGFSWEYSTLIRKISYKEGRLEAVAKGSVPGTIDDSFSIDEYEGNLRVVTTDESANGLYILDPDLKEIGRLDNLAKGEQVYSARLMGDTGYFVTFRNTDPLFSADLSDPENPQILGELKIPGFSEYLHPYGEGRLLGIGMDADEETGATGGVKLSMFNVSDPADVKEEHTLILENVYSADVLYDYRAALIDTDRNIIGFSAYKGAQEKYYLFSYDPDKGFTCLLEEQVNGSSQRAGRGLYIENVLYVVKGNIIESYGMDDFKKTGDIIL
ncbi:MULTISPECIES: beta-propeller domain-containing protein [Eubacteriales]|uniref:beta-propeller domain-containing protein n=1 Tax=Eubacteriales TaxID=186802 RepID=UPI00051ACE38|nr:MULTISPECIES: beta-propeller domain-containing protein [Eubacteriales]